ncbi:MAG TPA: hypothetical protein VFV22_00770 [Candidatus Paceibacterota bacterium]|nr:hypothetical protein [Candidatus Paceibacterota bacterium]
MLSTEEAFKKLSVVRDDLIKQVTSDGELPLNISTIRVGRTLTFLVKKKGIPETTDLNSLRDELIVTAKSHGLMVDENASRVGEVNVSVVAIA